MLHVAVVREIRRLLDEGQLSQRSIAARLGVSRGVIGQIAAGTRGLHGSGETIRMVKPAPTQALATRCPGCGGKVYAPCRLCRVRAFARSVARRSPCPKSVIEKDVTDMTDMTELVLTSPEPAPQCPQTV